MSEVIHLVTDPRQIALGWLARHLPRLFPRAPRSVCGIVLWGDGRPGPAPDAPLCPACVAIDGRDTATITARTNAVGDYWVRGAK